MTVDALTEAGHILAEAHDQHAELQMVLLLSGHDDRAADHGLAADIVARAWKSEYTDPEPVFVEAPCICIECQRFRSAGNHEAVD
jgi:hypothetical protein